LSRADRLTGQAPLDRGGFRPAYREDEEKLALTRISQARLSPEQTSEAKAIARALVEAVRSHKPSGLDAFLHAYDLGSEEGVQPGWLVRPHRLDQRSRDRLGLARLLGRQPRLRYPR
jgi:hypothetical protein